MNNKLLLNDKSNSSDNSDKSINYVDLMKLDSFSSSHSDSFNSFNSPVHDSTGKVLVYWKKPKISFSNDSVLTKIKPITYYTIFCITCVAETEIQSLNIKDNTLSCSKCNNCFNFSIINCTKCMKQSYALKFNDKYVICKCGEQYYLTKNKKECCCIII